jgi:rfaE bifunctional protein kinase chain/domain
MLRHLTRKIDINKLLRKFRETTVLVVGDIVMDEFIWGKVSRISPEAPVPVVAVTHDTLLLGGAANVVNNVRSLGGKVLLIGVVGDDRMGEKIKELLAEKKIVLEGIIVEPGRPTSVKTRIIAHNQQVVRFDRESLQPISQQSHKQLLDFIDAYWKQVDGVIISDYGKGVVTQDLMSSIIVKKRADGKLVAVDPKIDNFELYKEVTVLTPNSEEAEAAAGKRIKDEDSLLELGELLLNRFASQAILITRGEEGMILFERQGRITKVPTMAKEVYDVTGAGDTVIGTLTLTLATGSDFPQAAVLANYAAGIVVGKVGTAVVTPEELRRAVTDYVYP